MTEDPTDELQRLRRQLRAVTAVNQQLQTQVDLRAPSRTSTVAGRNLRRIKRRSPPSVLRSVNTVLVYLPPEIEDALRRAARRGTRRGAQTSVTGRNLRRIKRRTPPGVVRSVNAVLVHLPPGVGDALRRATRRTTR